MPRFLPSSAEGASRVRWFDHSPSTWRRVEGPARSWSPGRSPGARLLSRAGRVPTFAPPRGGTTMATGKRSGGGDRKVKIAMDREVNRLREETPHKEFIGEPPDRVEKIAAEEIRKD